MTPRESQARLDGQGVSRETRNQIERLCGYITSDASVLSYCRSFINPALTDADIAKVRRGMVVRGKPDATTPAKPIDYEALAGNDTATRQAARDGSRELLKRQLIAGQHGFGDKDVIAFEAICKQVGLRRNAA